MKQTLITLLFLVPTILFSQVSETFESYIQQIEDSNTARIYFTSIMVTISDVDVMITVKTSDGKETEVLNTKVKWMVGMDNLRSIVGGYEIIYWPKINKLYVNNVQGKVESFFYGQTPIVITVQK